MTVQPFGRIVRAGISALMLCGLSVAGPATATAAPAPAAADSGLTPLVELSTERILLADKVAAAKFGTGAPIEDLVREQQVVDKAAQLAEAAGLDVPGTVEFFRAQIEASKVVQQGLYDQWTQHPELAPTQRPDLATEVRPELDRITGEFIDQLVATKELRGPDLRCVVSLADSEIGTGYKYRLDWLHGRALLGATEKLCA